ncbi:MAG: phage holin family protein [Paracoccaceae bacterium]
MDGTQSTTDGQNSTVELLQRLANGVPALFQKETQLLKTEINEAGTRVMTAIGLIAGAAIVALVALNVLAAALVELLAEVMATEWAALIVGGALALIALGMALKGQGDLKTAKLKPTRTQRSVASDVQAAKEAAR